MKTHNILFIGGPSDGKTMRTDQKKITVTTSAGYGKGSASISTQYIRETVKLGWHKRYIFRHKDLKPDETLSLLLTIYSYYREDHAVDNHDPS